MLGKNAPVAMSKVGTKLDNSSKSTWDASKTHKNTDFSIFTCPENLGPPFAGEKRAPAAMSKVGTKLAGSQNAPHRVVTKLSRFFMKIS